MNVKFFIFLVLALATCSFAQTIGLLRNDSGSFEGYTLFAPISYDMAYLIDNEGHLVHSWDCGFSPGQSCYLLENGHLLYTARAGFINPIFGGGGEGGRIREFDWDGTLIWDYELSNSSLLQHHDVEMLPSGNVLVIAWEYKSYSECVSAGRDPSLLSDGELWPDMIIEVEPIYPDSGRIVWEWHAWDHVVQDFDSTKPNYDVVSENPEKIDLNYISGPRGDGADWLHLNAVDYNSALDQIILSNHNFSELWIIDHATTTAEAADSAGDLLYRWGNPAAYGRGGSFDQQLFAQHDAQWIVSGLPGAGDILVFSNGRNNPPPLRHSEIVQITPPVDISGSYTISSDSAFGPVAPIWTYSATPETSWFAQNISGCQRLPNGNTLICSGPDGWFFEVTPDGSIVWEYVNPVNNAGPQIQGTIIDRNEVFRCYRYSSDYPGLIDQDLTPGEVIELTDTTGIESSDRLTPDGFKLSAFPNPFNSAVKISAPLEAVKIEIFDVNGRKIHTIYEESTEGLSTTRIEKENADSSPHRWRFYTWQPDESLGSGVYLVRAKFGDESVSKKITYLK